MYKSFDEFLKESLVVLTEKTVQMSTVFKGLEIKYEIDRDETPKDAVKEIEEFKIADTKVDLFDYFTKEAIADLRKQIIKELED